MDTAEFGTHITFIPDAPKPKTKVWRVVSKYETGQLGWIGWYAPWRKYSFYPEAGTLYEQVCLREIADFCERKTKEHKQNAGIKQPMKPQEGNHE